MRLLQDDEPLQPAPPPSPGHSWRERFHAQLNARLDPATVLASLAERLQDDPIGVFRAIASTLPKEVDIRSEPQTHHLILLRLVGQAQEKGIDLHALLEAPTLDAVDVSDDSASSTDLPDAPDRTGRKSTAPAAPAAPSWLR